MTGYPLPLGARAELYDPTRLAEFTAWLDRPRPYLGIDCETEGLAWGDSVRTVQFGDALTGWVLRADRDLSLIRDVLARPGRFVAWNAAFDTAHLKRLTGVDILPRASDTQTLAGLLDPRGPAGKGLGLKVWGADVLGADALEPETSLMAEFKANKWRRSDGWARIDVEHPAFVRYAALDPVMTYQLHAVMAPMLRDRAAHVRREQTVMRMCAGIRERGFLVDQEHAEAARLHYADRLTAAEAALKELGVDAVGSTRQMADRLSAEGLENLVEQTTIGNPSVTKTVLNRAGLAGSSVAPLAIEAKLAKRYGRDFIESYQHTSDGRVHPGLRSIGARTRRMACSSPNLQNVPKRGGSLVRGCFIPEPGHVLLSADYDQMELRYMGCHAHDAALTWDLAVGADLFGALADDVWPGRDMRNTAKVVVYASLYGAGGKALADITGLPAAEAMAVRTAFLARYPSLAAFDRRAQAALMSAGGVELPLSGWLPGDRDRPYTALNLLTQGGCRDAFGERLVAMDAAGITPFLRMLVHDEVILSVPAEDLADVAHTIRQVMPIQGLDIPIEVSLKTGPRWGDMTPLG